MGERMGELINLTITMVIKVDIGLTHKETFLDYVVMMVVNIGDIQSYWKTEYHQY